MTCHVCLGTRTVSVAALDGTQTRTCVACLRPPKGERAVPLWEQPVWRAWAEDLPVRDGAGRRAW